MKILYIRTMNKPKDHLAEMLMEGFKELKVELDTQEQMKNIDYYDYVIASSLRWDVMDDVVNANKKAKDRFCFIDTEDDPFIRSIYYHSSLSFKREKLTDTRVSYGQIRHAAWIIAGNRKPNQAIKLLKNIDYWRLSKQTDKYNLMPISLTASVSKPKKEEKIYNISFVASTRNPYRKRFAEQLVNYCRDKGYESYVNTLGTLPYEEYAKVIRQSKVALSLRGNGWDTIRYWEIASLGTCLFSERLPIDIKDNFIDKKEAVFFKDFEDSKDKLEWAMTDHKWEKIAENGYKKFMEYHTPKHRAEYVLSQIRDVM